jgi:uncharacterized caspase-like protein
MAKVALLIGVSDYGDGLTSLPGTQTDIQEMQRVLQNPKVSGFDVVDLLPNPDPLVMQEAIETLFSGRTKNDLLLLFFSGHGVKDFSWRTGKSNCGACQLCSRCDEQLTLQKTGDYS